VLDGKQLRDIVDRLEGRVVDIPEAGSGGSEVARERPAR
jgi:hypothetical protein